MASDRWSKESKAYLDALGGYVENPLLKKKRANIDKLASQLSKEDEEAQRALLKQKRDVGRGRLSKQEKLRRSMQGDSLISYSFKVKPSLIEDLKKLSLIKTKLMRELIEEALQEYIDRHVED